MPYIKASHPPVTTLTIELPTPKESLPAELRQPEFVRYALAGTLYSRGRVSGRQARLLTGDSRRRFEEKMASYGFSLLPDDSETVATELDVDF